MPLRVFGALIALAVLLFAGAGRAAPVWLEATMPGVPIGTQVEYLEDPTGGLTTAEVAGPPWSAGFAPLTADNPNFGYRDATVWLRIRVERGASAGPWMLEVTYPLLDYVDFVVHIFSEKARQYYDLERLWKTATKLEPAELTAAPKRRRAAAKPAASAPRKKRA